MSLVGAALSYVGLKEDPRGSNRGPDIDQFTGGRAEPWCGHFVSFLFDAVGRPLPNYRKPSPTQHNDYASVTFMERVFSEHDWLVRTPEPGDVAFYPSRGRSDSGPGRHVDLVVAVDPMARTYDAVSGNWGDGVVLRKSVPYRMANAFGRRP